MKVYCLYFHFERDQESVVRSIHMTKKGAILEQCRYTVQCLLDLLWSDASDGHWLQQQATLLEETELTMEQLERHLKEITVWADKEEIYSELQEHTLFP